MPDRPGGFEQAKIDDGFRAIAGAGSLTDLDQLIRTKPVLSSPIFHAQLRQYRLTNQAEFEKLPENFTAFMSAYDAFFTVLHHRLYLEQRDSDPVVGRESADIFGPDFLVELIRNLGSRLPQAQGPTFDPAIGQIGVLAEAEGILSTVLQLPKFEPISGTSWTLLLVQCSSCRHMRLALRAHLLDFRLAPNLLEMVKRGRINNDFCPHCGTERCFPLRAWVQERPAPADNIGALACICRVDDSESIYLPPPGTVRNPDYDRVLEIRMEMMMRQLSADPLRGEIHEGTGVLTNGIAYSTTELNWRLQQKEGQTQATIAYNDIVAEVSGKIRSGILSYRDTESLIQKISAQVCNTWPVVTADPAGDLTEALVRNLVSETCAEAQGLAAVHRVQLAGLVSQCYTGLGHIGLAQMSLARGKDLLTECPEGDHRAGATLVLTNVEAELLTAMGQRDEASELRQRVLSASGQEQDAISRLGRQQVLMNKALEMRVSGRLAEAIGAMKEDIQAFQALAVELSETPDINSARHGLSGCLANLSGVYQQCARNLELLHVLSESDANIEEFPPQILQRLQQLGSAQALQDMQEEMLERVHSVLDPELQEELTVRRLYEESEVLLREALEIAKELGDFEYLGIQSNSLGLLLDDLGRSAEAGEAMEDCLSYAAQIADYYRMAGAYWFLAMAAQEQGETELTLERLEQCLRAEIRRSVQGGRSIEGMLIRIGSAALDTADAGGDALRAILISESAKAIATSISLSRGIPLRGADTSWLDEILDRRESLRLRLMWDVNATEDLTDQLTAINKELGEARAELRLRSPRYALWRDATYLEISTADSVHQVLDEIGENVTYIGFQERDQEVFTYALWSGGQIIGRSPHPLLSAEETIGAGRSPNASVLAGLGAALLDPLAERLRHLQPDQRVIVSPSEPFKPIPFALLPFEGRPFCEWAHLSVVHGLSMLETFAARPSAELLQAMCIGAPIRPDVPDLPNGKKEIELAASALEAIGTAARPTIVGRAATITSLLERTENCDLLHFACHALSPGASGGEAQLLLSPDLMKRDSGILSEDRIITELALKRGCHVNLAGCSTGITGQEGPFFHKGLAIAFLVAGAGSVLASLWPIDDEETARFQAVYYERLAQGLQPAAALAATQREAIHGTLGDGLRDSANWAPFVLYGIG